LDHHTQGSLAKSLWRLNKRLRTIRSSNTWDQPVRRRDECQSGRLHRHRGLVRRHPGRGCRAHRYGWRLPVPISSAPTGKKLAGNCPCLACRP